jgi:electron transfer flavoprotein alpha subunit
MRLRPEARAAEAVARDPKGPIAEGPRRRDARAERGLRSRGDVERGAPTEGSGQAKATAAPSASRRVVDPACHVVVVSLANEPWAGAEAEWLGAARGLVDEAHGAVVLLRLDCVTPASDPEKAGADRLIAMRSATALANAQAEAVLAVTAMLDVRHVLFGDAGQDGDVARRVAVALGERPAVAVQRLRDGKVVSRSADGTEFHRPVPRVVALAEGAAEPLEGPERYEARPLPAPPVASVGVGHIRDLGSEPLSVADLPLNEADFIVSAGDGVTDWPAFFDVAGALSATIGGSRQVCDAGLLPRNRQVGASGTLVRAKCYLAFGISGAPQHLQGVQRCRLVAAVNTDLHAAMVKRADIAIIADAQEVMPALAALARGHRHDR